MEAFGARIAALLQRRLLEKYRANTCSECWTSCRGSVETIMYGRSPLRNLYDYWQLVRPVALAGAGGAGSAHPA